MLFVLFDARREIAEYPLVLVQAGGAFIVGLLPYLYIPLRAMVGPSDDVRPLTTWNGFFNLVSGAQFRGDMHFLSVDSAARRRGRRCRRSIDHLIDDLERRLPRAGPVRDRPARRARPVVRVAAHRARASSTSTSTRTTSATCSTTCSPPGSSWPSASAVAVDCGGQPGRRCASGHAASVVQFAILALPVVLLVSNWSVHDQSANQDGEPLTEQVFAALPPGRRPGHLLGHADAAQLQALHGRRPAGRRASAPTTRRHS